MEGMNMKSKSIRILSVLILLLSIMVFGALKTDGTVQAVTWMKSQKEKFIG